MIHSARWSLLCLVCALPSAPIAASAQTAPLSSTTMSTRSADQNWALNWSSETKYLGWRSTYRVPDLTGTRDAGSGAQITTSTGLQFVGRYEDLWKLQVNLRGGSMWSQMTTAGVRTSYSGFTDTSVGSTVTYYGFDGFQPFLSLDTNLPTATGAANRPKADPDISGKQNNGEGTNWGATIGANIPFDRAWMGTIGLGYTYRGPYTNWNNPGTVRLDPGDVFTLAASLNWKQGPYSLQSSVSYAIETVATQDGQNYFRSGDKFTINETFGYKHSDTWSSKISAGWVHAIKNEIYTNPPPAFGIEAFNSNGDTFSLGLSSSWKFDAWTLTPNAALFLRNRDDYDTADLKFIPAKTTVSAGLSGAHAFGAGAITAGATHTWAFEGEKIAAATPAVDTRAWTLTLGGNWKF